MKKIIVSLGIAVAAMTGLKNATHGNKASAAELVNAITAKKKKTKLKNINSNNPKVGLTDSGANNAAILYNQIDFGGNMVSFDAFNKAYQGYVNLKKAAN